MLDLRLHRQSDAARFGVLGIDLGTAVLYAIAILYYLDIYLVLLWYLVWHLNRIDLHSKFPPPTFGRIEVARND